MSIWASLSPALHPGSAHGHDAGIVHQHIHRPQRGLGGFQEFGKAGRVAHIQACRVQAILSRRLLRQFQVHIADADARTGGGQGFRSGEADAARPAGNGNHGALQVQRF